jgi:hypothetical protein
MALIVFLFSFKNKKKKMFSLFLSSSTRIMNVTVMVNHQQKVKKETVMPRLFLKISLILFALFIYPRWWW